ncbi:MAG: hypothetical protein JW731_08220 [Bacteroidales bacterium]|nr:hypothetical protein [Bacteroidales bacterium]
MLLRHFVPKDYGQNIIIEACATVNGSANNTTDTDTGYLPEIHILFEAIGMRPETGAIFKLDICNDDNDYFLTAYPFNELMEVYTRPFNLTGMNNFGFPGYWRHAKLMGKTGRFLLHQFPVRKLPESASNKKMFDFLYYLYSAIQDSGRYNYF